MMTPGLKTQAILDPGLAPQPTVYTRTLSVFSGAARVKEPRYPPLTSKQRGPIFWRPRLFYRPPCVDVTVTLRGRPDVVTPNVGGEGVQSIGSWDSGRRNIGLKRGDPHSPARILRPKRGDKRGWERTAKLASALNDLSYR